MDVRSLQFNTVTTNAEMSNVRVMMDSNTISVIEADSEQRGDSKRVSDFLYIAQLIFWSYTKHV